MLRANNVFVQLTLIVLFAVVAYSCLLRGVSIDDSMPPQEPEPSSEITMIASEDKNGNVNVNSMHHDDSSLTTYIWHRGEPFNALETKRPDDASSLTIDALSIGSKFNVQQMKGQARSWGSHWSIRYLFGTTEQDDAAPQCHQKVTDLARLPPCFKVLS